MNTWVRVVMGALVMPTLLFFGCASQIVPLKYSSPMGRGPISEARALDGPAAAKDLAEAKRMLKAGEYSMVIPRLQSLAMQFPGDPSGIEARYYLGLAYYNIGGYNEALQGFREYVELAPQGELAASAREYADRLSGQGTPKSAQDGMDMKIEAAKTKVASNPEDSAAKMELANLLWDASRYGEAGKVYEELLAKWPNLMNDTVVRVRVCREKDGRLTVLTPDETMRRFYEKEPLQIYNVSSFRSGRLENWTDTRTKFYNVTGQAVNRSDQPLNDCRVTVTIYGFGQMVYDTKAVSLGTLQPGESRAFSVQFSNFDEMVNITRHECVGSFRR